jgi:DNA-binding MarR family transcriptional regulator
VVARTGMDKMSVSRAIASLARQQRVLRKPDPADGRRTLLRLSATGQRLFEALSISAWARERQLFGSVSEADQAQLAAILDRLVDGLLAADAAAPR